MNKRQKLFLILTAILITTIAIATTHYSFPQQKPETGKLKVVATFYPLAFFAQQIGGEQVSIKQLIPDNTEVHNWQPSFADIMSTEEADVILYNGASLDHWFEDDILPVINTTNKVIVDTTEGVQLLEAGNSNQEPEGNYDPHTWISPFTAKQQAQNIYNNLIQKDPDNSEYYSERWQNLKTRFEELDSNFTVGLSTRNKNDIFVEHSAFGYLANRYGFEQYGVIGISADEQPSASTYANLADLMIEYETYVVYVDPVYQQESAQTLKSELERLSGQNVQILKLYVMLGNVDGLDYFGQQEQNLENLKIGLGAS